MLNCIHCNTGAWTICLPSSTSLSITGDSLIIIARALPGGSLGQESASDTVTAIIERLHEIEQVFLQVHIAMYKVHHNILRRAIAETAMSVNSPSQHTLFLANDRIDSNGNGDIVFGDSSTLFFQADRPGMEGFDFQKLTLDSKKSHDGNPGTIGISSGAKRRHL
jgi:hypothetical protein